MLRLILFYVMINALYHMYNLILEIYVIFAMSIRNYKSGAKRRKTTAEKQTKHEQIIHQTSRIDTFTIPVLLNQDILVSTIQFATETNDSIEVTNSQTPQIFDDQFEENYIHMIHSR